MLHIHYCILVDCFVDAEHFIMSSANLSHVTDPLLSLHKGVIDVVSQNR
jgi:hypothetical protein